MSKRKVEFTYYERSKDGGVKKIISRGAFIQFGCAYEEFETGIGNYTTAIIEMEDGHIKSIPAEDLVFTDKLDDLVPGEL